VAKTELTGGQVEVQGGEQVTASGQQEDAAGAHPGEVAFERLREEIVAVSEAELLPLNVDVMAALATALGAAPGIAAQRPQIQAEFRTFDCELLEKLEGYALAASHAQAVWRLSSDAHAELPRLVKTLTVVREQLLGDVRALVGHGLLEAVPIEPRRGALARHALAEDVLTLVTTLKDRWSTLEGKTPFTVARLNEHASMALELLYALGRQRSATERASLALQRQQAFTLLLRCYDRIRRAIVYLYEDSGEANAIAPSLYGPRRSRRRERAALSTEET
jgi:hypothetical protein